MGPWGLSLTGNYQKRYHDSASSITQQPRFVSAYETVNGQFFYTGLKSFKFTVGARNLFNRNPAVRKLRGDDEQLHRRLRCQLRRSARQVRLRQRGVLDPLKGLRATALRLGTHDFTSTECRAAKRYYSHTSWPRARFHSRLCQTAAGTHSVRTRLLSWSVRDGARGSGGAEAQLCSSRQSDSDPNATRTVVIARLLPTSIATCCTHESEIPGEPSITR